jgi:hypothetical protein
MNQVRPLLAVVAAALTLAACEGTGSITDPAFRSDKAAPAAHAGSGLHADNGGWVGSGYDLIPCQNGGLVAGCPSGDSGGFVGSGYDLTACENGGTYGSGYDACTAGLAAGNTGTLGSGYSPAVVGMPGVPGVRHRSFQRPSAAAPRLDVSAPTVADCVPPSENGGWVGSGYNFCAS